MIDKYFPHIKLTDIVRSVSFRSRFGGGGGGPRTLPRNRINHSRYLKLQLDEAWRVAEEEQNQVVAITKRSGVYIEFKGHPGYELVTKSLEDMRTKQVRLLNVREKEEAILNEVTQELEYKKTIYATVYVANEQKDLFFKKIREYAESDLPSGNPRNKELIDSIDDIYKALLIDSFWQDSSIDIPNKEPKWCEVWLSDSKQITIDRFSRLIERENIISKSGVILFPERAVKLILVNRNQLEQITRLSDDIAEYRLATETASFWTNLQNRDQVDWVQDLVNRTEISTTSDVSICILDTGINNGHPLLRGLLSDMNCQSVFDEWGINDHHKNGHGTLMAGIAAYGDLLIALLTNKNISISHHLESVKLLPPRKESTTDPELWGYITSQAISRIEIQNPHTKRIICMAVSSEDTKKRGRPTSWSASLDQLSSGANDDNRRLIINCIGNFTDVENWHNYPDAQITGAAHDPAQAWNALTVGAYTSLDTINDSTMNGFQPIAPAGGLSPFTTTSTTWEDKWPIKPDILMEGGNLAADQNRFTTQHDDLSVISTYFQPQTSHFFPFSMTSAATAYAAWFAAQIQARYSDFWPETIRALMIHSADWTDTMLLQFGGISSRSDLTNLPKSRVKSIMRMCGYGVPDLDRALYSTQNSLTLIAQEYIQPFHKVGGDYKTKDMHFYSLPWPKSVLLSLPDNTEVRMRITLSYFIEPGPGEKGWKDRYRYASHGLRFDINSPGESEREFINRINAANLDEDSYSTTHSASNHWVIGSQARDKGSIHSDIWHGTAAELASSSFIAVFPRTGWWKERTNLEKWNRQTRYALIVSITTPEENIDFYTSVATQIGITPKVIIEV